MLLVKLQNKEHLVQKLADAEKQGDKERKDRERELSQERIKESLKVLEKKLHTFTEIT